MEPVLLPTGEAPKPAAASMTGATPAYRTESADRAGRAGRADRADRAGRADRADRADRAGRGADRGLWAMLLAAVAWWEQP